MGKEMTITEIFDRAKKQFDGGDLSEGYVVNGLPFHSYYTNKEWQDYVKRMPKDVKAQFDDGKGGEMQEHPRKGVVYPPKMASYASSSRFMYSQGQKFDGFEYEKQLPTGLGGFDAKPAHIKIKTTAHQANYFRTLPLHSSQKEVEKTAEYSIFSYYLTPNYDFIHDVLYYGNDIEVLEPIDLRVNFKQMTKGLNIKYNG